MSWDNTVKRTHRTTPTSGVGQLEIETENRGTRHTTIYEGGELLSEDDIQGNVSWISREGTYDGVWVQEYVELSRDDRGTMYSGGETIEFQHGLTPEESWFTVTYGDHSEHDPEFCPCGEGTGYWYGITGAHHGAPPAVCVGMEAWPTDPLPIPAIGSTPTAPAGIAVTPPNTTSLNPGGIGGMSGQNQSSPKCQWDGNIVTGMLMRSELGKQALTNFLKNRRNRILSCAEGVVVRNDYGTITRHWSGMTFRDREKNPRKYDILIPYNLSNEAAAVWLYHELIHGSGIEDESIAYTKQAAFIVAYSKIDLEIAKAMTEQMGKMMTWTENGPKVNFDEIRNHANNPVYQSGAPNTGPWWRTNAPEKDVTKGFKDAVSAFEAFGDIFNWNDAPPPMIVIAGRIS